MAGVLGGVSVADGTTWIDEDSSLSAGEVVVITDEDVVPSSLMVVLGSVVVEIELLSALPIDYIQYEYTHAVHVQTGTYILHTYIMYVRICVYHQPH